MGHQLWETLRLRPPLLPTFRPLVLFLPADSLVNVSLQIVMPVGLVVTIVALVFVVLEYPGKLRPLLCPRTMVRANMALQVLLLG